jgi:flavin reductase (DIM6/NTAB) family NADH-FMN oxidoreductase RutF
MPISPDEFRTALAKFASGVTIVTSKDANAKLHGITVSAFCSLSLDPPLILVCIENTAACHFAVGASGLFAVNVLNEEQIHLSNHFAQSIPDKFDGIEFREGLDGVPLLENVLANLECRLVNSHENGDHTIFVGRVENTSLNGQGNPLLYFNGLYRALGDAFD